MRFYSTRFQTAVVADSCPYYSTMDTTYVVATRRLSSSNNNVRDVNKTPFLRSRIKRSSSCRDCAHKDITWSSVPSSARSIVEAAIGEKNRNPAPDGC
jgi:hypothetical protein